MTDDQLKAAIAKMLPDKLEYYEFESAKLWDRELHRPSYDTELLHLCSLVEQSLSDSEKREYIKNLVTVVNESEWSKWPTATATWQQRVTALAKIKNIEI